MAFRHAFDRPEKPVVDTLAVVVFRYRNESDGTLREAGDVTGLFFNGFTDFASMSRIHLPI